ncbi:hypothetical protein, partial [Limnobacter sp.]|uniref:hypothetical protein n=1 Tax=Limnobacter sp. TaxID=2003368 RepID=UPI00273689D7
SHMADINEGYKFSWHQDTPHCNVQSSSSNTPATLVYLGEAPSKNILAGVYAKASATTLGTTAEDRFCVLYRNGANVHRFELPTTKSITGTTISRGKNFMEPEK